MAGRSKGYNQGWDPMQDEFDDSSTPQNGDDRPSLDLMDHCRLHITNIPRALNQDGLYTAFSKFGTLVECFVSTDPEKRYALVSFETPGEAKLAMMKLNRTEPLNLVINIAYKRAKRQNDDKQRGYNGGARNRDDRGYRENVSASCSGYRMNNQQPREVSGSSSSHRPQPQPSLAERRQDMANGDSLDNLVEDAGMLNKSMEPDMELELLKLKQLQIQAQQLDCQQRILLIKQKKSTTNTRYVMPDGKIIVRTVESEDQDENFGSGGGDANRESEQCSSEGKIKRSSQESDANSTASTCVLCSEERSRYDEATSADKSDSNNKTDSDKTTCIKTDTDTKTTDTSRIPSKMDASSKNNGKSIKKTDSVMTYADFYDDSENEADETNRLIHLRNNDYQDIIEDNLKIVIALAGYPKSKIQLQQMELFQQCLSDVMDMQEKAGLLKNPPVFLDYYLNRGAIVCICRDLETRNWMIRISRGLQERMSTNLILLKAKLKRLCLAYLKIPDTCWPATAQDVFKLLQYFNPTLRVDMWKVYSQSKVDDVEYTSFLIDRVSGEIIRGPSFKNIIDYKQMEFELSGYSEIYYEYLMSDIDEDLHSVSSRVKLLNELKSAQSTPRNQSDCSLLQAQSTEKETATERPTEEELIDKKEKVEVDDVGKVNEELKTDAHIEVLDEHMEDSSIYNENEIAICSEDNIANQIDNVEDADERQIAASESVAAYSEITESIAESNDNLIARNSNINIDSNRGIAYHRRTNYLHVENELKIAITLDGYPQDKLEGTHIRRLKLLFKEYLHKDMKQQRFANLIIPKFQDVYLSNGAVIYICDSLETKDYLTEVLPKLVNSTGWKLTFKDVKNLVRYTRIVMRLPKEHANIESKVILHKLQEKYSALKPECWKYYSDVAGKQKRQFGVDPESLDIIKGPDFDPEYAGQKLSFRIIDRQRRDTGLEEASQDCEDDTQDYEQTIGNTELKEKVLKLLYVPIKSYTANSLNRIRTSHYSDEVADDLKLYVGPTNYPESRIDETLFHTIKKTFENIVYKSFEKDEINELSMPRFHDIYLFDGVIFVICQNMDSRCWVEDVLAMVNTKLQITLKSTEYRGAVGFISMMVKTCLGVDEVTSILQSNNPRIRTKFWRTINTVKSKTKLDVVMQIDKLSAEVIKSPNFNKYVGDNKVEFQLGHLQTLLQPLLETEALTKKQQRKLRKTNAKKQRELKTKESSTELTFAILRNELKNEYPDFKVDDCTVNPKCDKNPEVTEPVIKIEVQQTETDLVPIIIESENKLTSIEREDICKMVVNIPSEILPKEEEDLSLIFDLLEDNNPGLNPELWVVTNNFGNYEKGKFILSIDKQSASVIRSNKFFPFVLGHKLKVLL